ncbi:hypothetical protein TNCV_4911661 [Trichonephila clavipes]|nr:hypothetical protein TNCV_4911661 [Trichonephila clavipes]
MKEGLIASSYECPKCNEQMGLNERKSVVLDGFEWRCLKRTREQTGRRPLNAGPAVEKGILQRSCRARQGAETNKRLPEGGVGKLINDHLVGRRCQILESPTFQCVKFRQRVPKCKFFQKEVNYLYLHHLWVEGVCGTDPGKKRVRQKNWKRPENLRVSCEASWDYVLITLRKVCGAKGSLTSQDPCTSLATESKQSFSGQKNVKIPSSSLKKRRLTDLNISTTGCFIYLTLMPVMRECRSSIILCRKDGQERVVAYWSKCLSKPERNYCVTFEKSYWLLQALHRAFPSLISMAKISFYVPIMPL